MSLLSRAATRLLEVRMPTPPGTPWGSSVPLSNGMLATSAAGVSVTQDSVAGIAAVWACVHVIADAVGTLPIRQYSGTGPSRVEIEVSPVIVEPSAEFHQIDFISSGTASMALRGNFYGQIVDRDRKLYPTQIQPLSPDEVRVRRASDGSLEYWVRGKLVAVDDVFHVPNLMGPGDIVGMNPIQALRTTFGLAQAGLDYGAAFYANSANASGFLVSEEDLTEEETINLARQWIGMHQGVNQAHLPAVLTGGLSWHQISINPQDAQFIQARELSTREVTMIFRVPPHLISDIDKTTSWGAGIEQQELGWVRGGLSGYLRRWEVALSSLVPPGEFVEFDLRRRLRGDSVQRSAVIVNLRNAGVINANEARILYEDLAGIGPSGDVYLQPLNMGEAGTPTGVPVPKGSSSSDRPPEKRSDDPLDWVIQVHNHIPPAPERQAPVVNIAAAPAPEVHVSAPVVNVAPAAVRVVPAQVHVDAPVVHNHLPEAKAVVRKVTRDDEGNIDGFIEKPAP